MSRVPWADSLRRLRATVRRGIGRLRGWRPRLSERRVLALLAGLLTAVVVLPHWGVLYLDTRPDLYLRPGRVLAECLSTWEPGTGLGTNNYDMGYLPVAVVVWTLQFLTLPPWLSMRVWRVGLYLLAGFAARTLHRDLTDAEPDGGRSAAAGRLAVTVAYVANPYVVASANTTPVMLPYALMPLMLLALRRSLRVPRPWVGVAGFGVVFFAMSGINAGVVSFFLLAAAPLVVVDAVLRERVPVRRAVLAVAGCGAVAVAVSFYWILGTATALGTASSVASGTEDPRVVASVTSFAEVIRGLGSWLLYSSNGLGPYMGSFVAYITDPVVVVASFTLPVVALLALWRSRSPGRLLGFGLLLLGVVLMVGANPPTDPTPLGRALLWGFDHVGLLLAFRTTFKAGAIAFLGMALLAGLGVRATWPGLSRSGRAWLGGVLAVLVGLSVAPALLGRLYPAPLKVPAYWTTAAYDLDTRQPHARIWVLPGESNATYRWRRLGVDDFVGSLTDRPTVYRRSFPSGTPGAVDAMAGVDQALQTRTSPPGLISSYARYLGAGDVLVRNDLAWELIGGVRPADMVPQANADPGLRLSALYGRPGTNVSPSRLVHGQVPGESSLPPLMRYAVEREAGPVRSMDPAREVVLAGSNAAVVPAVWARILDGRQPFRLTPQMSDTDLATALEQGDRVVLTDTNRRRASNDNKLSVTGPLLTAGTVAKNVRTLGRPVDETTMTYHGLRDVRASGSGSIFGPTPYGRPFLAVDGNRATAWTVGDFGTAPGHWLRIDLDGPRAIDTLTISPQHTAGQRVGEVLVRVGGASRTVDLADGRPAVVQLGRTVRASSVRLTIKSVVGAGVNQVGIAEVRIPGVHPEESVRLPERVERVAASRPAAADALRHDPLDVLLSTAAVEGETRLNRTFVIPVDRRFRLRAQVTEFERTRRWRHCRPLGLLDGRVLRARAAGAVPRPSYDMDGRVLPTTLQLRGCDPVALTAGEHEFRAMPAVLADDLWLSSPGAPRPVGAAAPVRSWSRTATTFEVTTSPSTDGRLLTIAESWEPRWRATVDGRPVRTRMVNGYAIGVPVPPGGPHRVHVFFAGQRYYPFALWLSLAALAGCTAAGLVGRRRGRREPGERR